MEIKKDENLFSAYKNSMIEDLENARENIYKSLVEDKDSLVASLPESIFVNYFLPCFINKNTSNDKWLLEWISIAGNPNSYVRIFKDGNIKETLFYVPPIFNSNFINNSISIKDILLAGQERSINLPIIGTRFLFEALNDTSSKLVSNLDDKYLQEWISIFKRYNLIQEESNNKPNDNIDSYLEL